MRALNRTRTVLAGVAAGATLVLAGCGGDDEAGSGDLAGYIPASVPAYVEGTIRPEGQVRDNLEQLTDNVAGIDDPGKLIIDQVNSELSEAEESLTYEDDIEPWLGEKAAAFVGDFTGDDDRVGFVVATTDSSAAQSFLDKIAKMAGDSIEEGSYEGTDYRLSPDDEAFGIVDGALVFAGSEQAFEDVVDASGGDSLEDNGDYSDLLDESPEDSLAHVFVDAESFLAEVRKNLEPDTKRFFNSLGQQGDPGSSIASLVPGPDRLEMQALSTAEGATDAATSQLLERLPADAFAAFAAPEVGKGLSMVIDQLDESGVPGEIPPGQLKEGLKGFGIDLERVASSIGDVGLYAQGTTRRNLGGAVVVETDDAQSVAKTLNTVEKLLRQRRVPGYTPLPGGAAGFAIRDPQELGPQPIVVLASGERLVIGYGEQAAREAVAGGAGQTLAGNPVYAQATDALGDEEPTGFVDLQAMFGLIEAVRPDVTEDSDYATAQRYLEKLGYVVFGSGTQGDFASARFILGLAD